MIFQDAKNAILTYGVPHYEISVALNHHVDELLVGLIAEIRESSKPKRKSNSSIENEVWLIILFPVDCYDEFIRFM